MLAFIVVDYLQLLDHKKTLVFSIFCNYQSTTTQTISNLLCSLLKQLVQVNGLSDPITSLYNQCCLDGTWPSLNVLTKILSQELRSFYHVYIVLDALALDPKNIYSTDLLGSVCGGLVIIYWTG